MAKLSIGQLKKTVLQEYKWRYICPACTNIAIWTSNKMLGVKVTCEICKKEILLDNEKNYIKVR